jgi:hypothetical protein
MSRIRFKIALVFAVAVGTLPAVSQQRPSSTEKRPPDPPPNHVEVRFALGKQPLTCKQFEITIKGGDRTILNGSFESGFSVPEATSTYRGLLDVVIKCGDQRWHFPEVGKWSLQQGWWWVGTDYPPFQEMLQNDKTFKDAVWVKYLIVDPTNDEVFYVYKFCPAKLKDQKPGPCYDDADTVDPKTGNLHLTIPVVASKPKQ